MRSIAHLPQQALLTFLGLSALVVPLILIISNFSLIGLFVKSPPPTPTTGTIAVSETSGVVKASNPGFELLSDNDFSLREKEELVVVLDNVLTSANYLALTTGELKGLVAQETAASLKELFKGPSLVLVTGDIVQGQQLATALGEKGIKVALYLTGD